MRAHHNVHRAVRHAFEGGIDLFGGAKAAHLRHFHGPLGKAIGNGLKVLLGQEGSGCQNGHLFAARNRHKGGTQRNFGFAKTHVAAHQPIHRARANHVLDDVVNRRFLVRSFFKAKVVGKGFVIVRRVAEGVAFAGGAAGVDVEQLGSRVAHLFGGFALGLVPGGAAQFVQRGFVGTHPGVTADQLQLAHGHVEHGVVGVLQMQKLLQGRLALGIFVAHIHIDKPPVAANTVGVVDYGVAHVQFAQVFDERFYVADLLLLFAPAGGGGGGKEFGLSDQINAVLQPSEAAGQRRGGDAELFITRYEFNQRVKNRRVNAAGAQKVQQALASAIAFGQHQNAVLGVAGVVF